MDEIDFVIPLRRRNMIFQTTIESIISNYHPKVIYIITNKQDIEYLECDIKKWEKFITKIILLDENLFFIKNYNLFRSDIEILYTNIDNNSREFGWWFQQIIKLGAFKQIEDLSDPFVVWDSDLILLQKWDLFDCKDNKYKFAILQECSKNEFNKIEYSKSIKKVLGLEAVEPNNIGTFIPHHFIFHHKILDKMLNFIEYRNINDLNGINDCWIQIIMSLSKNYYRFSEYKCIATFMNKYYSDFLTFYPFEKYGKYGIRYRDSSEIVEKLKIFCNKIDNDNLTYENFKLFIKNNYENEPSYIQIEHVNY